MLYKIQFITIALTLQVSVSPAQNLSLKGRSAIELNFGYCNNSDAKEGISTIGASYISETNNFTGGIGYS